MSSTPSPALLTDTLLLAQRHLILMSRRPASVMGAVLFPLVFAFLFYTVMGTVMERAGIDYGQYLLPAIVLQAMFFTAMSASVWAAEDATAGMATRLRAMPISRLAPVASLLAGELGRAVISLAVLLAVGHGFGFRFERGWAAAGPFVALALGMAAAACMAYLVLGFALAHVEKVQVLGALIFYPLLLVSNLFTPAAAFPDWIRPIVENQPVSRIADALRAVSTAHWPDPGHAVLVAVAWIVAILVLFTLAAPRAFGRHA